MENSELLDLIEAELKRMEFTYNRVRRKSGREVIDSDFCSRSSVVSRYDFRFIPRTDCVEAICCLPFRVTEKTRSALCEFACLVSSSICRGKFIIENDMLFGQMILDVEAIKNDVSRAMEWGFNLLRDSADDYIEGFALVTLGLKSPQEALEICQKKKEPPSPPEPPTGGRPPKSRKAPTSKKGASPEKEPVLPLEEVLPPEDVPPEEPSAYLLEGVNVKGDVPLEKIIQAVKNFRAGKRCPRVRNPRLSILLYGPPGTGKTSFAKYLADEVDASLRVVKASELLSKYVGETEQRIADAFKSAQKQGEILFLDEFDSLMQDRKFADKSWEVSQVNQILQEMENFNGVLVAATNFSETLDKAVLRRFNFKLELDYATDEGKIALFGRYFDSSLTDEEKVRLKAISRLTPGDYRTVCEKLFFLEGGESNQARLEALEAESSSKGRERLKIGF